MEGQEVDRAYPPVALAGVMGIRRRCSAIEVAAGGEGGALEMRMGPACPALPRLKSCGRTMAPACQRAPRPLLQHGGITTRFSKNVERDSALRGAGSWRAGEYALGHVEPHIPSADPDRASEESRSRRYWTGSLSAATVEPATGMRGRIHRRRLSQWVVTSDAVAGPAPTAGENRAASKPQRRTRVRSYRRIAGGGRLLHRRPLRRSQAFRDIFSGDVRGRAMSRCRRF